MVLLARAADRLYWAARYLERAEDTARIIRAFNDMMVDFPGEQEMSWRPLLAINGAPDLHIPSGTGEVEVLTALIADSLAPSSIASAIAASRANLRATREVLPREAWHAVNGLSHYVERFATGAVKRQRRDAFLMRVIDDSRRFDGVIDSTMTRRNSYRMLRLGRLIERAEMTTRVLGVRAATLLQSAANGSVGISDEVQWMAILRSVSALQMYQRANKFAVSGEGVVWFLLFDGAFPRSVRGCLNEMRTSLDELPHPEDVLTALDQADRMLDLCEPVASDGHKLDDAMEALQIAISAVDRAIYRSYVVSQQAPIASGEQPGQSQS